MKLDFVYCPRCNVIHAPGNHILAGDTINRRAVASVTQPVTPDPKMTDEVAALAQALCPVESVSPPQLIKRKRGRPKTQTPAGRKEYLRVKAKERRDRRGTK